MAYFNALSAVSDAQASKCGCGGTIAVENYPQGLSKFSDLMNTDLLVTAGENYESNICFTRGCLSDAVTKISAAGDGVLSLPSTFDICVATDDEVRLIGHNRCELDSIYTVGAVDSAANTVKLTGLNITKEEIYTEQINTEKYRPLGCAQISTTTNTKTPPRYIEHVDADTIVLSAGAHARADYMNVVGVTFASGNDTAVSTINNIVLTGDTLTAPDVGINTPVRVLSVNEVETSDGTVTYIKLEQAPTSSGCVNATIRRGLLFPIHSRLNDEGCIDLFIPGASTAKLQLHSSWASEQPDQFIVGRYSVMAHWGEVRNTKMVPRSKALMAGRMIIRSSHVFPSL